MPRILIAAALALVLLFLTSADAGNLRRALHTADHAAHGLGSGVETPRGSDSSSSTGSDSGSDSDSDSGSDLGSAMGSDAPSDLGMHAAISNWRYEAMSEKVKDLVSGLHADFTRLQKVQDQEEAVNAELGFSQHIKAVSTHVIDLATSLMTEFPDGIPPSSKGEEVLAELESTKGVVEHFVDSLSQIVSSRIKGDKSSMESSKKQILELDNDMNKELQDLGAKVNFEESLDRQRRREERPMTTAPSRTVPSSSVGMTKEGGGAKGHTYRISHDSFQLSPHEKNTLDMVVAQAEESVVVNLKKEAQKQKHDDGHKK